MGEMDHIHDAEDERQSDPYQGIGTADDESIDDELEELLGAPPRLRGRNPRGIRPFKNGLNDLPRKITAERRFLSASA